MGEKFPDLMAEIGKAWTDKGPIRLLLMYEARFGRISDRLLEMALDEDR